MGALTTSRPLPQLGSASVFRFLPAGAGWPSTILGMLDPELLERITARRAELDELEELLAKQLAEVRAERDELAVAERVLERVSEQLAGERASSAPMPGQVGGQAVMLIPHRTSGLEEVTLPPDYQRILADLLRRRLKAIRSRWRILPPGKIAVIVLAVLRHDQRLADMADRNDVSESTVRRWHDELTGLLASQAPRLDRALMKVAKQGGEVVLIDGTLIRTQRRTGKADRRNYSGKHRSHGLQLLALTDETGRLIWISAAPPGRTHDNTAARHDHILAHLRAAGLGALADLGFRGLDNDISDPVIVTGYAASRTHKLTPGQEDANRASPSDAHRSSTASPTSRTGGSSPSSVVTPPGPPNSCALCRPDEPRSQPLTDDLLRGLTPATSTSTRGPITPAL
ncbi:transposase family protein [Streptomyces europaeiscabiei]|uniref:transposase family protein n=1 Tax=Streptomyces europaeiscabiei TaxID=146819 RepID=UPI0038F7C53D